MAAYKDEQRGTWYVSFHYYDWTGKNCRKVKRGFKTKREATEWERHFRRGVFWYFAALSQFPVRHPKRMAKKLGKW